MLSVIGRISTRETAERVVAHILMKPGQRARFMGVWQPS